MQLHDSNVRVALALVWLGCRADHSDERHIEHTGNLDDTAALTNDTDSGDSAYNPACDEMAEIPVTADYLEGYTGAEDFAFDAEGYLVSIDPRGNLLAINQAGEQYVILPQATAMGAGTRFLPNGDIVFCDAEKGNLVRVDPLFPVATVVLSGLAYPNGLDVDPDGFVYVAEQNSGQVRRINPDTGEYTTVLSGLYNPNGLSFSPGYNRMFVGSFGAGVVWASDRQSDNTWSTPRIYATTPEAPGVPPDWCTVYASEGESCPSYGGYGLGECGTGETGAPVCEQLADIEACATLAKGDGCTTLRGEVAVNSACTDSGTEGELFCPYTSKDRLDACENVPEYDPCFTETMSGECYRSAQGLLGCLDTSTYYDGWIAGCADKEVGEICSIESEVYPGIGLCADGSDFGFFGNVCLPGGVTYSEHGGLDGVNVDECDNLYVTEYIQGRVWRFDDENAEPQQVARVRSNWIPNMHWGNGIGGWERNVLYVMDREGGGVYALNLNIEGHGDAWDPG